MEDMNVAGILSPIIKIENICETILDLPEGYDITVLRTALAERPVDHHQKILAFSRVFYDTCSELYVSSPDIPDHKMEVDAPEAATIVAHPNDEGGLRKDHVQPPPYYAPEKKNEEQSQQLPTIVKGFQPMNADYHNKVVEQAPVSVRGKDGQVNDNNIASTIKSPSAPKLGLPDTMGASSHPSSDDSDDETSRVKESKSKRGIHYLLEQTIEVFIDDTQDQVRKLNPPESTSKSSQTLLGLVVDSLDDRNISAQRGSEWLSLVEVGYGERRRGTVHYALAAIGFEGWHRFKVQERMKLQPSTVQKTAAMEVSGSLLGSRPEELSIETTEWNRRRKNLSTHLTRGRKWRRLVDAFGYGILLVHPWQFAKAREQLLDEFIKQLANDLEKCRVLKLLGNQIKLLFERGRTDELEFYKQLKNCGFPLPDQVATITFQDLDKLYQEIQGLNTRGRLLVKDVGFQFDTTSLQKLASKTWLSDDIIIACLHLSKKSDFVRVGWSIPTHRETAPRTSIRNPFERAAKQVEEWRAKMENGPPVCLFPLFQTNNHFSLLEVNEREGYVYHYDSMNYNRDQSDGSIRDNTVVKKACEEGFPNLNYIEKSGIQQMDAHSCGPIVIRHARRRMVDKPATSSNALDNDSEDLRFECIGLLKWAWNTGVLSEAPAAKRRIKRLIAQQGGMRAQKRQRTRHS